MNPLHIFVNYIECYVIYFAKPKENERMYTITSLMEIIWRIALFILCNMLSARRAGAFNFDMYFVYLRMEGGDEEMEI